MTGSQTIGATGYKGEPVDTFHLCSGCLKRQSLGKTSDGWLGCVVCQKQVDEAVAAFLKNKFGGKQ